MKFKVGDLVWCEFNRNDYNLRGDLPGVVIRINTSAPNGLFYWVDVPEHKCPIAGNHWGAWSAKETWLRHRKPPDDIEGNQLGSWELCPWKPGIRVKEQA